MRNPDTNRFVKRCGVFFIVSDAGAIVVPDAQGVEELVMPR